MNAPEQNFELHRFEDAKLAYFTFEGLVEWPILKKAISYACEEEVGDPEWEIIWDFRSNVSLVFDPGDVAAMVDFVKGYAQEGRRPERSWSWCQSSTKVSCGFTSTCPQRAALP